jgi:hypothetical protein
MQVVRFSPQREFLFAPRYHHVDLPVQSLQFGDKAETPLFSNTWTDHDRVLVDQLATFAARYQFRGFTLQLLHAVIGD